MTSAVTVFSQKRVSTVLVDYKNNRFQAPLDVDRIGQRNIFYKNNNIFADENKNVYLIEEYAKQVLFTYEDGTEDTIVLGYSDSNELRSAIAIAKWNENVSEKKYQLIHSEGDVITPSACYNEDLNRIFVAVTVYGDTLYPELNNSSLAIPTNKGAFDKMTMLLAYDFDLNYKSHQIYNYNNYSKILLVPTKTGVRLFDENISPDDSLASEFTFIKPDRIDRNILMVDLDANLQPTGSGYQLIGPQTEYYSADEDHTIISIGGGAYKADTITISLTNLSNNAEWADTIQNESKWNAQGLVLDLDHSTNRIDTLAQLSSYRYKKYPTEQTPYYATQDFVQALSYYDSVVYVNGKEIKDPDATEFNILSYHIPTDQTYAVELKNTTMTGGYFFHHSRVPGNVVDSFNLAFNADEKFVASSRSSHNGASHVLAKYNPDNLSIEWARSTTFPSRNKDQTKISQSNKNLLIYGQALSPKQDLEPYIRENALTGVGNKLVIYDCRPISYFEAYPNEGFYVRFLNLSDRNATYKWHFTSRDSSTEIHPRHKFGTVDGTYTITLIATNECGSDSFSRDIIIDRRNFINVKELNTDYSLVIYPNPSQSGQTIHLRGEHLNTIKEVALYSIDGRLLDSQIEVLSDQSAVLKTSGSLTTGVYILSLSIGESKLHARLIVR